MPGKLRRMRWVAAVTRHIPPDQFGRYLATGIANTLFGYLSFAVLTALLEDVFPQSYILAGVVASLLNITFSFLNYKWFVFRTKGHYFREWRRSVAVYSGGIALGALLLPVFVWLIRSCTGLVRSAPYIAGALLTALTIVYAFLGHKKYSFRAPD